MDKKKIMRFPRDPDSFVEQLEKLERSAFQLIGQIKQMRLALGYVFLKIKHMVGHDYWEGYFQAKFAPHGIKLRTAQNWMRRARTGKVYVPQSKNVKVSFLPATDKEAVERRKDVAKARADVNEAAHDHPAFKLLLPMSSRKS